MHSLSKRSNLAGVRVGFYAGDPELVHYLSEVRKHAGFMVPGPVQAAAVVAFDDDQHVDEQRERYRRRLELMASVLGALGVKCELPYGPAGRGHVRVAVVQPDDRLALVAERIAG